MNRLAVLTGGSTGLGNFFVTALVEAGFDVAFSYRSNGAAANALLAQVDEMGGRAIALACDVGHGEQVALFYEKVCAWHGDAPDVLINNAGVQTWSPLLELSQESWDDVIRTNLTGCFLNTQNAARLMVEKGKQGAIINIGSGCNKLAFPRLVDYTASKGGVEQFTKVSAVELGPVGIRVNCVAPGAIATERTSSEADDYAATWSKITPLRRVGTPKDVADTVLFLTTEAASFITGQTIYVDGGVFAQANWPYGT